MCRLGPPFPQVVPGRGRRAGCGDDAQPSREEGESGGAKPPDPGRPRGNPPWGIPLSRSERGPRGAPGPPLNSLSLSRDWYPRRNRTPHGPTTVALTIHDTECNSHRPFSPRGRAWKVSRAPRSPQGRAPTPELPKKGLDLGLSRAMGSRKLGRGNSY